MDILRCGWRITSDDHADRVCRSVPIDGDPPPPVSVSALIGFLGSALCVCVFADL